MIEIRRAVVLSSFFGPTGWHPMHRGNFFSGITSAFWGVSFALIGFVIFVASVGDISLIRALLAVLAAYSIVGIAYGVWAARNAVLRSQMPRR